MSALQGDSPMEPCGPQIRVLVAEDDDDHAEILGYALSRSGFCQEVQRVQDGQQLLDALSRMGLSDAGLPDLVLLDLHMPRMNGLEALAAIKRNAALASVPVVVLSTSAASHDRECAFRFHANAYLLKPAEFSKYREMVVDLLRFWARWNVSKGD